MVYARLTIELDALEPVKLPRYKGSVLRGGFGAAFRRVSCPFPRRACSECLLRQSCAYSYVFETPRPENAGILHRSYAVPHPFIIEPPEDEATSLVPGEKLEFGFTLVGRALDYVPYFLYAFEQMAERGLGPGRRRLLVASVRQNGQMYYDGSSKSIVSPLRKHLLRFDLPRNKVESATLTFETPTRIIHRGKMARRLHFHILMRSLLRRIGLLALLHDRPAEIDHRGLIAASEAVETSDMVLAGYEWRRYSGRQERIVEMEGMTGTVTYEGDLGLFLPYLQAGEILHVGKGTAFGMGRYRMEVG